MQEICRILLVEDDEDDRLLFESSLKTSRTPYQLENAPGVPQAKSILEQSEELPKVVVSDLWLGAENGIDLLRWMRGSARFKGVPFILIVTTISPEALEEAYQAGANSCLLKPSNVVDWNDTVQTLVKWWCEYAVAPKTVNVQRPDGWKGV